MNQQRSSELEKVKGRVLSHMIKSSVLPPREALKDVPGQSTIVALETFFHEMYYLAAKGYVVMYTNPRGGAGRGKTWAEAINGGWGELDYKDCMAAADYLEKQKFINPKKMGVTGGSYGGYYRQAGPVPHGFYEFFEGLRGVWFYAVYTQFQHIGAVFFGFKGVFKHVPAPEGGYYRVPRVYSF